MHRDAYRDVVDSGLLLLRVICIVNMCLLVILLGTSINNQAYKDSVAKKVEANPKEYHVYLDGKEITPGTVDPRNYRVKENGDEIYLETIERTRMMPTPIPLMFP